MESFCDYSTTRRTSLALKKKMDRWTDKLLQRYNYMPSSYMAIQRNTCPNLWHQIKAQIELKEPHSEVEIFFVFHGLHEVLVLSIVLHLIHEVLVLSIVLHLIHEVLNLSRVLHGIHELLVLSIVFHLIHEVLYFPKSKVLYGLHELLVLYIVLLLIHEVLNLSKVLHGLHEVSSCLVHSTSSNPYSTQIVQSTSWTS